MMVIDMAKKLNLVIAFMMSLAISLSLLSLSLSLSSCCQTSTTHYQ